MSLAGLATLLGLAGFALLSLVAALVGGLTAPRRRSSASSDARALFIHAIAPTAVPAVIAATVAVPSFLMHEIPRANEWPGVILVLFAIAGAVRLGWLAARAIRTLLASRALVRKWIAAADPLPLEPWGIRASKVDAGFPVVAVAGLFRPHVFVDRRVIEACSPAELAAVAAHERAHVTARDNLRRLAIAACVGHDSHAASAWRVAAERAADERATSSPHVAADLAAALVRVARIGPAPFLPVAAISTIHDGGSLEQRVRRLLDVSPSDRKSSPRTWPALVTASMIAAAVMLGTPVPKAVHGVLELLVQRLP